MDSEKISLDLMEFNENGLKILADNTCSTARKTPCYYNKDFKLIRSLVTSILKQYVISNDSVCYPVKCIDVLGSAGISGLLWKKYLGEQIMVKINNHHPEACQIINENAKRNNLTVDVSNNDACIVLHERGYNFIYLDCTNEASHYFDSAFRNISRNGLLVITTKDDSSLHGNNPDVAMRRYEGRITRTFYYQELGIRLFIAALARAAAKYNKSISVLCSFMHKSTFTVAVKSQKGPVLANKCIENIRLLKHCMVCEDRAFYPVPDGFPIDPQGVKLNCSCAENAPSHTSLDLGPIWAGPIFDSTFIRGMLNEETITLNLDLKHHLNVLLLEADCSTKEFSTAESIKRLKIENVDHPPFYFNIHKHHPQLSQLMKINKVIDALKEAGFRASKTHFDKLAVRTNAPLQKLYDIMQNLVKTNC